MDAVLNSYDLIGQGLKDWSAAPPRLREPDEVEVEPDVPRHLPSAALSSQDDDAAIAAQSSEWIAD